MIAHILRDSGFGCNAFLGGISSNYNTNFWTSARNVCVVEADEYDRSFLKLHPDVAVISSMDADHLDIYGTGAAVEEAFLAFSGKIKNEGTLINKYGLPLPHPGKNIRQHSYHLSDTDADIVAEDIRVGEGSYRFDVAADNWSLPGVQLNIGGRHNIENALAAIAVARQLGLQDEEIRQAMERFRGVKRRFEYHVQRGEAVYIDDYAHHPGELRALIGSARELYPGKRCVLIFQPHLFSRTRDFAPAFAESLDMADEVVLLPVYPARELPIEGISSATILERMHIAEKQILDKNEILAWLKKQGKRENLLLITAGAGDIDTLVEPIAELMRG
jgi:UDP-N-acetylmuramate--alanine ligase